MDANGIDKAGLYDFYSKFGFIDTNDGKMMLELNKQLNENEAVLAAEIFHAFEKPTLRIVPLYKVRILSRP
jgi:hypothetical protein